MQTTPEQFIQKFKDDFSKNQKEKELLKEHFTCGYCYHFAVMLEGVFKHGNRSVDLMYNPVENHFAAKINEKLYDINGEINDTEEWMTWTEYQKFEPLDSERVIKNCLYKEYDGL